MTFASIRASVIQVDADGRPTVSTWTARLVGDGLAELAAAAAEHHPAADVLIVADGRPRR